MNSSFSGIIRTDFSKMLTDSNDGCDPNKIVPLGRFGEAGKDLKFNLSLIISYFSGECAGAVAFLASSNASYLTGETIGINGGMHARV